MENSIKSQIDKIDRMSGDKMSKDGLKGNMGKAVDHLRRQNAEKGIAHSGMEKGSMKKMDRDEDCY